jgi:transposase
MRLQEYARNPNKRTAYVQPPGLLLVGVDVSPANHSACMGTQTRISRRKLAFTHTHEGCRMFETVLNRERAKNTCCRVLMAMEPSGISWLALYERLTGCGYEVCLGNWQAVCHNRKTMQEGTSQTDAKDAYSVFDLLQQGKFFLPVARAPERKAADRLMPRPMALQKRVSQLRHQLRAALHLAFPALHALMKDLTQPTALRFLHTTPTPATVLRNGRLHFLEKWQPRRRCGPWRSDQFHTIYDLAQDSIGLADPYRINEFEIKALAPDLADALAKHKLDVAKVLALLAHRPDCQLLVTLPRIGQPTAAASLTASGDSSASTHGQQLVTLAGLDSRVFESGSSIRKLPKISPVGSAYLRYGLSHSAKRLVAHEPHFRAYHQRRKQQAPGKGAGQRALVAVSAKVIRMIYRILTDKEGDTPQKDQMIAQDSAAQRQAAEPYPSRSSADVGGEGNPGGAFGPHRGGENPSVRAGPSPLLETRTKNRRSRATGKTSIAPTRIGREHCKVRSHRSNSSCCSVYSYGRCATRNRSPEGCPRKKCLTF